MFVIAALTGATLFLVRQSVATQAQAQIEQEASNAILTVQAALNQRELILSKKADLLAMVAYIRNGDPSAIEDISEEAWQSNDYLIFQKTKTEGWLAQGDDLRTFLGDFVAALPQIEFPAGLNV